SNWGLRREPGSLRTSRSSSISAPRRVASTASTGQVQWPRVQIVSVIAPPSRLGVVRGGEADLQRPDRQATTPPAAAGDPGALAVVDDLGTVLVEGDVEQVRVLEAHRISRAVGEGAVVLPGLADEQDPPLSRPDHEG